MDPGLRWTVGGTMLASDVRVCVCAFASRDTVPALVLGLASCGSRREATRERAAL